MNSLKTKFTKFPITASAIGPSTFLVSFEAFFYCLMQKSLSWIILSKSFLDKFFQVTNINGAQGADSTTLVMTEYTRAATIYSDSQIKTITQNNFQCHKFHFHR